MAEAYIIDAVRTPMGRKKGSLAAMHPADLAAHPLKVLMERPKAAARLKTESQRLAVEAFGRKDGAIFGFTPDELTKRLNL